MTHLDGHEVRLIRKGPTQPGTLNSASSIDIVVDRLFEINTGFVQKIEGEGMPLFENRNLHGDLFVEYNVVLPIQLSPQQRRSKYSLYVEAHSIDPFFISAELSEAFQTESNHDEL